MPQVSLAAPLQADIAQIAAQNGAYYWPAINPKAIVIAVHGMTQQGGSFATVAKRLNEQGFTVIATDMRGHGRWFHQPQSSKGKDKLSYRKSAQDLLDLSSAVRNANPGIPVFCLGESVGSGVVTLAASQTPKLFDGLILVSPGTHPHAYNPVMVVRDFLVGITHLNKQLDVRPYITRYSSEDARITSEMIHDDLSRTSLTAKEILGTAAFLRTMPGSARKLPPNISVLILQGSDDRIVTMSSAKSLLEKFPTSSKKMVVIPHSGHILLGTAYLKDSVTTPLIDWLDSKVPAAEIIHTASGATTTSEAPITANAIESSD